MNIKNNNNALGAIIFSLIACLSLPVLAEVNLGANNIALTNITLTNKALTNIALTTETAESDAMRSRISFRFFSENEKDHVFQKILENSGMLSKLEQQFEINFKLAAPIYFHFQHTKESQLIEAEIEASGHVISLPYSFLYTLYQGLSTKYDQQNEAIEQIFVATVEFYIWSEVANIIIQNRQLEIQGSRSTAHDNFASIMMLNQNGPASDYLLDASEAYLLIRSLMSEEQDDLDELVSDQKRYKHILCLTVGFDQLTKSAESEPLYLEVFPMKNGQSNQCPLSYLEIMRNWHEALIPSLREDNLLNYWLNQQNLLKNQ